MSDKDNNDKKSPEEEEKNSVPAEEEKDGTAPSSEETAEDSPEEKPSPYDLKRVADKMGISPESLYERFCALSETIGVKMEREADLAYSNRESALNQLLLCCKLLFFVLMAGLLAFGAKSEFVDLTSLQSEGLFERGVVITILGLAVLGITFFGWSTLTNLRQRFIHHEQRRTALNRYQSAVEKMDLDSPVIFSASYVSSQYTPNAEDVKKAWPKTLGQFNNYRLILIVVSLAATVLLGLLWYLAAPEAAAIAATAAS